MLNTHREGAQQVEINEKAVVSHKAEHAAVDVGDSFSGFVA